MYGVGGSEAIARDMDSILFSSNFKLMHSDLYNYEQPSQQPSLASSNLARYRSAPSSFFASLLNNGVAGGGDDDEYTNRESEIMFQGFDSDESDAIDLKFPKALKQEMTEAINDYSSVSAIASSEMVYATTVPAADHNSVLGDSPYAENSFRGLNSSVGMESLNQVKSSGNYSNLIRQNSSPAGFLSNLADEIGFGVPGDVGNFRASSRTNIEASSKTIRLSSYMTFSSGPSSCSPITENGNDNVGTSSQQNGHLGSGQNGGQSSGRYLPNSPNDSTSNNLKRNRDSEVKMFSNLNGFDSQNGDSKHYSSGLVHQLSSPSTSVEMATLENFRPFQQGSTPCKIRAKRGFATHPRSIAERVRRTRISERMKKLQDLFPNMDKQANTADMLDLAVESIKDIQKEVQTLNEIRAKCTCSCKRIQTSPTARPALCKDY